MNAVHLKLETVIILTRTYEKMPDRNPKYDVNSLKLQELNTLAEAQLKSLMMLCRVIRRGTAS